MAKNKWELVKSRFSEIEAWLKQGLLEKQIIVNLGIGKTTWEHYKHIHPELTELLKRGVSAQVTEVENSLFKNATGFYYFVTEMVKCKNTDGSERVEVVVIKKFKPPETAAMCFFLKNKNKKDWSDNPTMLDIKREELEMRKTESAFKEW